MCVLLCIVPALSHRRRDSQKWKFPWSWEQQWTACRPFSGVCMCESHVELRLKEVCRPLVWMKRMSSLALRECSWSIFLFFFYCVLQRCALYLCDSLSFSAVWLVAMRPVVFEESDIPLKDTNVCSVVMDMLGLRLLSLAPLCQRGCVFYFFLFLCSFFSSCSGQNQTQNFLSTLPVPVGCWLPWRWFSCSVGLVC